MKRRTQWRKFEYAMFIPKRPWKTEDAQRFADFYADCLGAQRRKVVCDIQSRRNRNSTIGEFCEDKIRLSLELDSDGRWRVLIHELAHYWSAAHNGLFLEAMQMTHKMFRVWHKEDLHVTT